MTVVEDGLKFPQLDKVPGLICTQMKPRLSGDLVLLDTTEVGETIQELSAQSETGHYLLFTHNITTHKTNLELLLEPGQQAELREERDLGKDLVRGKKEEGQDLGQEPHPNKIHPK